MTMPPNKPPQICPTMTEPWACTIRPFANPPRMLNTEPATIRKAEMFMKRAI